MKVASIRLDLPMTDHADTASVWHELVVPHLDNKAAVSDHYVYILRLPESAPPLTTVISALLHPLPRHAQETTRVDPGYKNLAHCSPSIYRPEASAHLQLPSKGRKTTERVLNDLENRHGTDLWTVRLQANGGPSIDIILLNDWTRITYEYDVWRREARDAEEHCLDNLPEALRMITAVQPSPSAVCFVSFVVQDMMEAIRQESFHSSSPGILAPDPPASQATTSPAKEALINDPVVTVAATKMLLARLAPDNPALSTEFNVRAAARGLI